jgi:hypothetical protein
MYFNKHSPNVYTESCWININGDHKN